jgi:sec-independent protein translocase protein TatA
VIAGPVELLILLAIILLFFGARRVPQLGRSFGQILTEFRKEVKENLGDEAELRERGEKGKLPRKGGEDPHPTEGRHRERSSVAKALWGW